MKNTQSGRRIRMLAVSWRPDVLEEIGALLPHGRNDVALVGGAYDRNQARRRVAELRPDVVLVEFGRPCVGGGEAVGLLREVPGEHRIIAFTTSGERETALEVISSGADGFLIGDDVRRNLCGAIRSVHDGDVHMGSEAASTLLAEYLSMRPVLSPAPGEVKLSPRESQVLAMIAEGLSNKAMADRLGVGRRAVDGYRENLRKKLGLPSPAWLTRYAMERGLNP